MDVKKYKYTLSPGQKGFCPRCGEMTLSLYIDTQTGQVLDSNVGLCKHRISCGYHYTPKKYSINNRYKDSQTKTDIVMKAALENQQEQNQPTSEEVPSPIGNTADNEQQTTEESEYFEWDTLDDIYSELPQGKRPNFRPGSYEEPKDRFLPMW